MAIPRSDAAYLLRRAGFGGTPAEIDALAQSPSWSAAVDRVLDTSADPPVQKPAIVDEPVHNDFIRVEVESWWLERMRSGPAPIVDKMALFWHGLFTSSEQKVPMRQMWDQLMLYRALALGNFHWLALFMSVQPAMLKYLDNAVSIAPDGVNENFARELMDLFLMGVGTSTHEDVTSMARAWSGHGLTADGSRYEFHPDLHDGGPKTLFGITRNWNAPDTIAEILKGSQAVVSSRYIVRRLWLYLAGSEPSDELVSQLAAFFRALNLDIKGLVRLIFLSPAFRSDAARNARVRTPVEWLVALHRGLDVPMSAASPQYALKSMGQTVFRPPTVAGWGRNHDWLGSSALWARGEYAIWLSWVASKPPYERLPGIENLEPAQAADAIFDTLGIVSPDPTTRAMVIDWAGGLQATTQPWAIRTHGAALVALTPDFELA